MSLLFFDGFDGYDSSGDLLTANATWFGVSGSISSTVRQGTGKSFLTNNYAHSYLQFSDQAGKTIYIGFALRKPDNININILILRSVWNTDSAQCSVRVSDLGYLELRAGDSATSTLLATGTIEIVANSFYYIEIGVLVANAGSCTIKVNGVTDINFTGDTQTQATNSIPYILFGNAIFYLDDLYVCNSDGSINNTYLGDVVCEILTPTSDSSIQWTRSTGADSYANVDEAIGAPNDADYNSALATNTGYRDEYGLSNLSTTAANVYGVKVNTRAQKSDIGSANFKHGINSGGTRQSVTITPGIGFANHQAIFETSNGAGTAWNTTTVNAALSLIEVG
jgi:hypothetical protein